VSADGGIQLDIWEVLEMDQNTSQKAPTPKDPITQAAPETCAFWNTFPPFVPNPAASFLNDFNCLADHEGWNKKKKRKYLVKALNAEIDFYSDESNRLVRWQRLCQEVGVGSEPESITKCKKVSQKTLIKHSSMADIKRDDTIVLEFLINSRFSGLFS
jgi:hypothetical protein